ncbi:flagellar hook-length control protein FliK [Limnohabitans sp. 2KL-27]|uniref:flagellar hook-length control protein FliK n=1 Tax=Limnohabitans sp. 2KL-27 TaxID=1100705 RepID=UPI000AA674BB|nr:flagellar hook-length control protein FliK [Limnohabitans sp. 2KL-27]
MTIALIETPSRAASSPKNQASEQKSESGTRQDTAEFGQVMSDVMGSPQETGPSSSGQALAGGPATLTGFATVLGSDALKAVHLGPHLNVITAEINAPDEHSLEAFARSQGLDETAVQWLMGTAPGMAPALPAQVSALTPADGQTGLVAGIGSLTPLDGQTGQVAGVGYLASIAPETTSVVLSESLGTASVTSADPIKTGAAPKPDMPVLQNGLNGAALWAMSLSTEQARIAAPAAQAPSDTASIQIHMMPPPAPAAVWMLRNTLSATATKEAAAAKTGMALSELDLTESASPELLESLSQAMAEGAASGPSGTAHPPGHGAHRHDLAAASRQEAQNADGSGAGPDAALAQRSENVQNLAEKMGQAVGQRILSEIEKGQWHLKLSLRPATLGHIEVEMRMRSGELDAVFTAPQALTRELLQDGMAKLKDTLSQMGMDVASMLVGDGQTRQRGGESTPGQMSKSTNTGENASESAPESTLAARPMKMGEDGWDVLV